MLIEKASKDDLPSPSCTSQASNELLTVLLVGERGLPAIGRSTNIYSQSFCANVAFRRTDAVFRD
jgi:hypothetical protein